MNTQHSNGKVKKGKGAPLPERSDLKIYRSQVALWKQHFFTTRVGEERGPRAVVNMVKRKSLTDFPGIAYPACSMTRSLNNKICQNLKLHLIWISLWNQHFCDPKNFLPCLK